MIKKPLKKLGIPYMGSKRKLAEKIIDKILEDNPNTKYIYDLFGGGGAISFEAIQRPEIEKVYYNEFDTGIVELLKKIKKDGITEDFYKWIDRETFDKMKDGKCWEGGLIKTCWSFGNRGITYMYGDTIEDFKKEAHDYIVNGKDFPEIENIKEKDPEKRRSYLTKCIKKLFNFYIKDNKEELKEYKNIIEKKYTKETMLKFTTWLRTTGIKAKKINELTNTEMAGHYLTTASQPAIPTLELWNKLKQSDKIKEVPEWVEDLFSEDEKYKETILNELYDKDKKELLNKLYKYNSLKQIQHLTRINNLIKLKNNIEFNISNLSYEEVEITTPIEETVIYLDPPYEGTGKYQNDIDHDKLWEWVRNSPYKVYISSYKTPFETVMEMEHRSTLSATANNKVTEKLFINRGGK